ncbi:uncharacterized protein [Rutidosis leptorrhynchoides]|uniref:uncharacterized protein n=1 Tax=Rutidosis leptorrhynchoides TaxID=125765 RepID=UPI003A997776
MVLDRKLSDHCLILLRSKTVDFGPKPTKVFNNWINALGTREVISTAWNKEVNTNRPDIRFRLQLKNVKLALKEWSKEKFGDLDLAIKQAKNDASEWENVADSRDINDVECAKWLDARRHWLDKDKLKVNMLKQKSREKWAKEGEENTKYFHSLIKRRINKNSIRGLHINDVWVEDLSLIKSEIRKYHEQIFKESDVAGPSVPDIVTN